MATVMPGPGRGSTALRVDIREKWFAPVGDAPAKRALGEVAFSVAPGDMLALIGPSGCGKTTLLNLIGGLDGDFEGRIDLSAGTRLAYVFQEPRLLPWRTVEDNIRLVLDGDPGDQRRIEDVLAQVELASAAKLFASRLSLGMARRVALARAFVIEPALLLLDEPFVSLDEPTARRLRLLLRQLLALHRTTAIMVTHDLREAIMLARRLILLSASPGRLVGEIEVPLSDVERQDEGVIDAFRAELLVRPELAELRSLDEPPPAPVELGRRRAGT
jgi:ABC-type nitrate/sulfonate/bicarbonate transport system ATPase subunit